ncbi:MAG: N-acetylmuramoyl-L-alanine amidase [Proteobacteria bacterium SG_bin9]|nr:MAG: N-acetylmuramoyl-L-alanine amidase [Proteobacteria bacterium SG_bin9]
MATRAKQLVLWAFALGCSATLLHAPAALAQTWQPPQTSSPAAAQFPVASDVRVAGDAKQTRFILDLDRKVELRAFTLADPYRVVVDLPQVTFQLQNGAGETKRGLIKAFRYGLVMAGGSRLVFDLAGPAKIEKAHVVDAANGQPARLILELAAVDRTTFVQQLSADSRPQLRPAFGGTPIETTSATPAALNANAATGSKPDARPVIVIDPGHGGIDHGTEASTGEMEKTLVLDFAKALRDRIESSGKYRVVMTRSDDTFVALGERVKVARNHTAALFVSIHADALPRGDSSAQGATIYTLSDKASDAEAERLAELENKADAIAGFNLTEEPSDVADILIDLTQRETKTFSNRFARTLMGEMKSVARMHKHPLKSAGFKVLKAPDVPSVLIELGYVSNKDDLKLLVSESWRSRTVGSVAQAVEAFLGKRVVNATPGR